MVKWSPKDRRWPLDCAFYVIMRHLLMKWFVLMENIHWICRCRKFWAAWKTGMWGNFQCIHNCTKTKEKSIWFHTEKHRRRFSNMNYLHLIRRFRSRRDLPDQEQVCIFCLKITKYGKRTNSCEPLRKAIELRADETIRTIATERSDERIMGLTSRDLVAAEAHYRTTCYRNYTRPSLKSHQAVRMSKTCMQKWKKKH